MTDRKKLWMASMIKTHGSEEAVREFMRSSGKKSDRSTPRGFAKIDTDRVKQISKLGVEAREKKAAESENAKSKDNTQS